MTTTPLRYGPAEVQPAPLVVPLDPARGWAGSDLLRRTCAVVALPLAALLCLSLLGGRELSDTALWAWALVGPTCFYALARVLRPEPRSWARTPRHVLAGTATSYAVPVIAALSVPSSLATDAVVIPFGTVAFVLGVTTLLWGLVAVVVRSSRA